MTPFISDAVLALAIEILKTADIVVAHKAISAELGYSDARNFPCFLKNATGLALQQARARSRHVSAGDDRRVLDKLAIVSARFSAPSEQAKR